MEPNYRPMGISVILCCYNSINRISPTLDALCKQKLQTSFPWEIIIVDNASNDNTGNISKEIWESFENRPRIPFRVTYEPLPGLNNARKSGLTSAGYRYALFCDDDVWL